MNGWNTQTIVCTLHPQNYVFFFFRQKKTLVFSIKRVFFKVYLESNTMFEASYTGIRKFITSCSIVTLNGPTGAPLISRPSTPTIACSTSLNSISRVLKG